MSSSKNIRIDYFAMLKEQRGLASETRLTTASTLKELYEELKNEFGFTLPLESVKVAVADEFCSWTAPITTGDRIVFIPPVAGG